MSVLDFRFERERALAGRFRKGDRVLIGPAGAVGVVVAIHRVPSGATIDVLISGALVSTRPAAIAPAPPADPSPPPGVA